MTEKTKYPLLPYSALVWHMLKHYPETEYYTMSVRLRKKNVDNDKLLQAFKTAFANHPVFASEIDEEGLHYTVSKCDMLHGKYHSVDWEQDENEIGLKIVLNRILGDGISQQILCEDVVRAYVGLPLEKDNYWGYIKELEAKKKTKEYCLRQEILSAEFDNPIYPVSPAEDKFDEQASEGLIVVDISDCQEQIESFADMWLLPLNGLVVLATAMATMSIEHAGGAGLTWAYHGRESAVEQRIYGSLHRDIPIWIKRDTVPEMIRQTRRDIRKGIACSDCPYTLTSPKDSPWHRAVNVVSEIPWAQSGFEVFGKDLLLTFDRSRSAMTYLDVEIDEQTYCLTIRYAAHVFTQKKMKAYADMIKESIVRCILTSKE